MSSVFSPCRARLAPSEATGPLRQLLLASQRLRVTLGRWARRRRPPRTTLAGLLLLLLVCSTGPALARAESTPIPQAFRCDGDPLTATLVKGPMDDPEIPDPSTSLVPIGGNVVLAWRGLNLQLPRTNNAGAASFSDGKWWWSLEDPAHPRFRLRRPLGDIQDFACEPAS